MSAEIIEHPGGRRRDGDEPAKAGERVSRYWRKHMIKDFALRTAAMDTEAIGALVLIEDYYFIHGILPKSDAECARVCKLGVRKFARVRSQLFVGFDDEGRNAEIDASISEAERITSTRREAGRKGGASKAQAFARQQPQQNLRQPQPHTQTELQEEQKTASSPPAPPPSVLRARETGEAVAADALQSISLSARAHPGWRGLGAWVQHLLDDGAESVDVIVGITQCLRSLKGEPPSTFGYFTAAIDRARHARTAPLPEVARRPDHPAKHDLGQGGDVLRKRLGDDVFAAWFTGSKLVTNSDGTLTLSVSTEFKRSRIISNYADDCVAAFAAVFEMPVERLVVVVDARG